VSERRSVQRSSFNLTGRPRAPRRLPPLRPLQVTQDGAKSRRFAPRAIAGLVLLGCFAVGLTWMTRHRPELTSRATGQYVPEFAIRDVRTGQLHYLSDHSDRILAIVFTGTVCPIGELYLPRLNALARKFENRGVDVLAINSNASESAEDVAAHARVSEIQIPVLKDENNRVADQMLVERTCEALLIDRRGVLRYRGAIDDQYAQGSRRDQPVEHYLADAIEAVIAGKPVSPDMTQVIGCPIERTRPPRPLRTVAAREKSSMRDPSRPSSLASETMPGRPVTYTRDVAAILHRRCTTCHRPGQVAPFSLLTFEQARRWSSAIGEAVNDGRMPPWHADPNHGHFANDRSLTQAERSTLTHWIEQGSPPGELSQAPVPPIYPQGWSIGTPDFVYEMSDSFAVQPEGTVPIQRFRVATNLNEDLWVQAAEVRPGDRAVVHHICVYVDDHTKRQPSSPRVKNLLAAYTPGDIPSVFPPGVAKRIPPGSDLVFEVHYTPIGKSRFDRSTIGLIASSKPPDHLAVTRGIAGWGLKIPPRAASYPMKAAWTAPSDIHILSLSPHMHLRGKSFKFTAQYPDGHVEILLSVPHYDFNWQSAYRLAEPKALPKGTLIQCDALYDNSASNPANPDPDKTVLWGEQSWDEMMIGFMDFYEDSR
jgi:peroxiredoxin